VSKKQTDFSFDEAKKAATQRLSALATFMENMNDELHDKVPLDWAITLRTLEMKVSQASSPCLNENDMQQIVNLAQQLIYANPDISQQLTQFWNLYAEVFTILKANPKNTGYEPQGILIDNWSEIERLIHLRIIWYQSLNAIPLLSLPTLQ
jgi:CII-binding regulator of phage lambda lysogenization HflD